MTPMGRVGLGLVVVFVDIRIGSFDLVADPIGWLLVLAGLAPLLARHPGIQTAAVAAGVGLVLSAFQVLAEPPDVLGLVQSVAETAVVFSLCTALMVLLLRETDRRQAGIIRLLDLGLLGAAVAFYLLGPEEPTDPGAWAVPVVLLVIAAITMVVWFVVLLLRVRHEPALQAAGATGAPDAPAP